MQSLGIESYKQENDNRQCTSDSKSQADSCSICGYRVRDLHFVKAGILSSDQQKRVVSGLAPSSANTLTEKQKEMGVSRLVSVLSPVNQVFCFVLV